jgi:hypothetical protein
MISPETQLAELFAAASGPMSQTLGFPGLLNCMKANLNAIDGYVNQAVWGYIQ